MDMGRPCVLKRKHCSQVDAAAQVLPREGIESTSS
jgi:hypothetical protein